MTSLLEMEQSMLDDLLMQDEATLNGQERIQMDPLQQVKQNSYLNQNLTVFLSAIFRKRFLMNVVNVI